MTQTPPAVPDLSDATSRLELILGREGLARVQAAHVMVIGLGGVGSNCVEALARGGVGALTLVDCDAVEASNLNRQAIAFVSTIGMRKTEATRALVHAVNPACRVTLFDQRVTRENAQELLSASGALGGRISYVVDAIDTMSAKVALAELAEAHGIPLISAMGAANKLDPEKLRIADVMHTSVDPMSRVMRKECRKRGIRHLRVCFSSEEPRTRHTLPAADAQERPVLGTASYLPPIMGQMIAGDVIRTLAGLQ